jgi:hypothetical protein
VRGPQHKASYVDRARVDAATETTITLCEEGGSALWGSGGREVVVKDRHYAQWCVIFLKHVRRAEAVHDLHGVCQGAELAQLVA